MNGQLLPCLFNNFLEENMRKLCCWSCIPLSLKPIHIPNIIPKQSDLSDCDSWSSWLYCLYIYIYKLINIQTYWHVLVPVSRIRSYRFTESVKCRSSTSSSKRRLCKACRRKRVVGLCAPKAIPRSKAGAIAVVNIGKLCCTLYQ